MVDQIITDAQRSWHIEPCNNPPGWFTVGYHLGTMQTFVPFYHAQSRRQAEKYRDALRNEATRDEAMNKGKFPNVAG